MRAFALAISKFRFNWIVWNDSDSDNADANNRQTICIVVHKFLRQESFRWQRKPKKQKKYKIENASAFLAQLNVKIKFSQRKSVLFNELMLSFGFREEIRIFRRIFGF